jgi:hypothetical protein
MAKHKPKRYYAEMAIWFEADSDEAALEYLDGLSEVLRDEADDEVEDVAVTLINEVDRHGETIREGIDTQGEDDGDEEE